MNVQTIINKIVAPMIGALIVAGMSVGAVAHVSATKGGDAAVASDSTMSVRAERPNDWANHNRYAQANAALESAPRVVFMGNSITDFWPMKSPAFWAEHPDFCGRGISGQTSTQMLCRFREDVLNLNPEIVVILAGTNDIAQNQGYISPEYILGNILTMAELARGRGKKVAICSVLPCAAYSWRKDINPAPLIMELNSMIKEAVKTLNDPYVIYVDYYSALADDQGGLPKQLSGDGCHPNATGYKIMECVLIKALAPWLEGASGK